MTKRNTQFPFTNHGRLTEGMIITLADGPLDSTRRPYHVILVNYSRAQAKPFHTKHHEGKTRFGKTFDFESPARTLDISPNSEVPVIGFKALEKEPDVLKGGKTTNPSKKIDRLFEKKATRKRRVTRSAGKAPSR